MADLFVYTDYRTYLNEYLHLLKERKSFVSLRYYARKIGLDPGNLVKILGGQRHLSPEAVENVIVYHTFNEREAEFFRTLVAFAKAKRQSDIKTHFERLTALKRIEPFEMHSGVAQFYSAWYHSSIAGLLSFWDFDGSFENLAKRLSPPISARQAKESVALLKKLGVIAPDSQGRLKPVHNLVTSGDKWHSSAVHEYQRETIRLAEQALDTLPKTKRDISTVSFAVSKDDFKEICSLASEFRSTVMRIARESEKANRVYQMNIQIFPMTRDE